MTRNDLKQVVMENEIFMLRKAFDKACAADPCLRRIFADERIVLLGDSCFLCDYMLRMFGSDHATSRGWVRYTEYGHDGDRRERVLSDCAVRRMPLDALDPADGPLTVLAFVDCVGGLDRRAETLQALSSLRKRLATVDSRIIVSVLMPKVPVADAPVKSLAEREAGYLLWKHAADDPFLAYYEEIERTLRELAGVLGLQTTLVRFENVIAPDVEHTPSLPFGRILEESLSSGRVVCLDGDSRLHTGLTYVREACQGILEILCHPTRANGRIFNGPNIPLTACQLKRNIQNCFKKCLAYEERSLASDKFQSNRLNCRQMLRLKRVVPCNLSVVIKLIAAYRCGIPYDNQANIGFYEGKIGAIQSLELQILAEIDRICRKHGIRYFLAGGSLLGAVRYAAPIPWDDDLDVGFLRGEFEKFKSVSKTELDRTRFCYTQPYNNSGSHYTIDKIRIKNTFFSTNFSAKNACDDGVFVDLLVYDKTSNVPFLRWVHTALLHVATNCLLLKWYGGIYNKNTKFRTLEKIALKILRFVPFCLMHRFFDGVARFYRNKRNARWLIDTVGKKLNDGPLPNVGLDETRYVDFAGMRAPIPIDPVPYLTYAYGPDYITEPPLESRRCPHNFARIDLGNCLSGTVEPGYLEVSRRGELHEMFAKEEIEGEEVSA